jgi:hypothetical protein
MHIQFPTWQRKQHQLFQLLTLIQQQCTSLKSPFMISSSTSSVFEIDELDFSQYHLHQIITLSSSGIITMIRDLQLDDDDIISILTILTPFIPIYSLNLRYGSGLVRPFGMYPSLLLHSIQRVILDGCWRLDVRHLLTQGIPVTTWIDLLNEPFEMTENERLQVVILSNTYMGKWVDCHITETAINTEWMATLRSPTNYPLVFAQYDIWVKETIEYNQAIGFSNRPARGIHRHHLRRKPLISVQDTNS